jgi:protein TonB
MNRSLILIILFLLNISVYSQNDTTKAIIVKPETIDGMKVLTKADEMPQFKGGDDKFYKYVLSNINIPVAKKGDVLESKIIVSFIIDTLGHVRKPCIINPLSSDKLTPLEEQVLNAIKGMPAWIAAVNNDKTVPFQLVVPFNINWK